MAFAKRKMPQVVGVEASGEIAAVGEGVTHFKPGDPVVMYGALTCGTCKACREGRDNLCENVAGIMGFHIDGFARDRLNMPARLVIPVPKGVSLRDASCAPIGFSTVQHMLFDNARLESGETILVQAGGSGIGTVAILMAKAIGCTVITTVGDDDKVAFVPVGIVEDEQSFMWVSGLGDGAQVIVQGQDFVSEGQMVEAVSAAATASATD
jgi:alcohol dehydrogenase